MPTSDRNCVQLAGELRSERAGIHRQREEMEQERRNIAALSELLVMKITAEQPLLLPISPRPIAALEHSPLPEDDETTGTAASSAD